MMQAAAAWNQAGNQQLGEKLMREALAIVTQGEHHTAALGRGWRLR